MSQNPFEALGGGGFDMNALMQQAQQMQEQLASAQDKLAETVVEGAASGVTVRLNGVGDLMAVDIAPDAVDVSDADALADLGDLVVAAFRDAKAKADQAAAEAFGPGPMPGGLGGLGGGAPPSGRLGF